MGFSRKEYWNGLPCLPPGDLPHLGIEPMSPPLQADSLPLNHQGSPILSISSLQSVSSVGPFPNLWTVAQQASLSITNSQSFLKLMSIQSVMPYYHLFSVIPFSSCLQFFPASGSFPMSQLLTSGDQSIGASASTSPGSPWDFQESSPTPQLKSINTLVLSFLYGPALTPIHDYWKKHTFD